MSDNWKYNGDIDIAYGGYYWREDGYDDYVLAVRVTPCSDAGGPSNLYWIDDGSIYLGDQERQTQALSCIGVEPVDATRRDYVEACLAYYGIESGGYGGSTIVQHGATVADDASSSWDDSIEPEYKIHGNADLRRHIEREYLS